MPVDPVSISTYSELNRVGVLRSQRQDVFEQIALAYRKGEKITARKIAITLGIDTSSVAGRVNELKDKKRNLVVSGEVVKCDITGRPVHLLELTSYAKAMLKNEDEKQAKSA